MNSAEYNRAIEVFDRYAERIGDGQFLPSAYVRLVLNEALGGRDRATIPAYAVTAWQLHEDQGGGA